MDPQAQLFRGALPKSSGEYAELTKYKIQDTLIFRDDAEDEIRREQQTLQTLGIRSTWLPMTWNKPKDPRTNCYQAVKAVKLLLELKRQGRHVFFHCTAGQDRTGLVAGLYRMLVEQWSAQKAFRDEMCARGYADGGPSSKPAWISRAVAESLTPVFLALGREIETTGQLTGAACSKLPAPVNMPTCH